MIIDNLLIGLKSIKLYLYAGVAALVIGLGVGWYITDLKLDAAKANEQNAKNALVVSEDSVKTLTAQIARINSELDAAQRLNTAKQQAVADALHKQDETDKSRLALEAKLKSRPAGTSCILPKDLQEAWDAN